LESVTPKVRPKPIGFKTSATTGMSALAAEVDTALLKIRALEAVSAGFTIACSALCLTHPSAAKPIRTIPTNNPIHRFI
jgi:hypothetical protein